MTSISLNPIRLVATLAVSLSPAAPLFAQTMPGTNPVKIFIVAGESNTSGKGTISPSTTPGTLDHVYANDETGRYQFLKSGGSYAVRNDVWIRSYVTTATLTPPTTPAVGNLTTGYGSNSGLIGPEFGFGHIIGDVYENQILIVKVGVDAATLAYSFCPPSSRIGEPEPTTSSQKGFYYKEIIRLVNEAKNNLGTYFPGYNGGGYEIAGLAWHQGYNDRQTPDQSAAYETNMANFINDIRSADKGIGVANMPVVIASAAMDWNYHYSDVELAQLKMADATAYPAFVGNVAVVDTRVPYDGLQFWYTTGDSPTREGFHWNRSGKSFLHIGMAMGDAMSSMVPTRIPFRMRASGGSGGVTLTWKNGTETPASVRVLRNGVQIAVGAAVNPPTFVDATAPLGVNNYELQFTMPVTPCPPLTISHNSGITNLKGNQRINGTRLTWDNNRGYSGITVKRNGAIIAASLPGTTTTYTDFSPPTGSVTYSVEPTDAGGTPVAVQVAVSAAPTGGALIYEPFDMTAATAITGKEGGIGLDEKWDGDGNIQVTSDNLYTFGSLPVFGNRIARTTSNGACAIPIGNTLHEAGLMEHGAQLWFSFLCQNPNNSNIHPTFALGDDILTYHNTVAQGGNAFGAKLLSGNKVIGMIHKDGVEVAATAAQATIGASEVVLVVGRITWGANASAPDTIEIYTPGTNLVLDTPLSVSAVVDQSKFKVLSMWGNVAAPNMDEIRFGDSYLDVIGQGADTSGDFTAPSPATMSFATPPAATSTTAITMTATAASDTNGVQYFFDETSGNPGGTDSGWQDSPVYSDTGLNPNTQYTYTVQARDKSVNNNTNTASSPASATTLALDTTPPTPSPMTWATPPAATGSASITMTASTASDPSGVEYFFDETSGNPGGTDSGWQDSPTYLDTGLNPSTSYTYQVKARDKSPAANETAFSSSAQATTQALFVVTAFHWDGNDTTANADGGAGTWAGGSNNWDSGATAGLNTAWNNSNNDTAIFGGSAGTVTIGAGGVTVGGLTFNTTGYTIDASTNAVTFSTGTNRINLVMPTATTAATITGAVAGTDANLVFSSHPLSNATLNFNGTSANGWTGTTTINPNVTLSLSASNQALVNTSAVSGPAITLNGGAITLTNTTTTGEDTINRISNTAAIASYGTTSIIATNTASSARQYSETIGAVTVSNGQLVLGFTNVPNGGGTPANSQTLLLSGTTGLTVNSTSTVAFYSGGSGAGSMNTNSHVRINGITTNTATGLIIGPWMTAGTSAAQSDWAVYASTDGSSARVASRGISASAETLWTATTGNYTWGGTAPTVSQAAAKLSADRMVYTLRATFAETNSGATPGSTWNLNGGTDTFTFATHALTNGDVVHFRSSSAYGLADNQAYYVKNVSGTTFQLALTPALDTTVDLTGSITSGTAFMSAGLNLNGKTLGLNGYITGSTGTASIGGGSGSTITLPSATSGNLYLHGAANLWVDPSIKDNGSGLLTLVKSGTFNLMLAGNNTYSGGTVINAGQITFNTAGSWVSGQDVTFGGSGTISASVGSLTGDVLDVKQGAVGVINGTSAITFAATSGTGTIVRNGGGTSVGNLSLGNASLFTGTLQVSQASGTNPNPTVVFSSLGDGGALQYGGGQADANQTVTIQFNGSSAMTWGTRQVQILPRSVTGGTINAPKSMILENNSTSTSATLTINTDLLNSADRTGQSFILGGSNGGNNAFNGVIGNSTVNGAALNLEKTGGGKWILGGTNTYTGNTLASAGILQLAKQASLYNNGAAAAWSKTNINVNSGATLALNVGGSGEFTKANVITLLGLADATTNGFKTGAILGLDTTSGDFLYDGIIANPNNGNNVLGLTKLGSNKLTLNQTNTFTGATTLTRGKLTIATTGLINGTSAVTIGTTSTAAATEFNYNSSTALSKPVSFAAGSTGGTLSGTGTITPNVTVTSGNTLAPGNSIGALGFGGTLTLDTGSISSFEVDADNNTNRDRVTGVSTLTYGGKLRITASGTLNAGDSWDLYDFGSQSGTFDNNGSFGTDGASDSDLPDLGSGLSWAFDYTTGTLSVVGGGASAYDTWKAANAPGSNPDDDTDGDGVTNALEFVVGGTSATNDQDKLPQVATDGTNMTFTFKRKQSSIDPKTSLAIEVGTDLVTWNTAPSPYTVPDGVTAGPPVTVVEGVPADYDTVTLTVPLDSARKFARLRVWILP